VAARFEVYQDKAGESRFRLKAATGDRGGRRELPVQGRRPRRRGGGEAGRRRGDRGRGLAPGKHATRWAAFRCRRGCNPVVAVVSLWASPIPADLRPQTRRIRGKPRPLRGTPTMASHIRPKRCWLRAYTAWEDLTDRGDRRFLERSELPYAAIDIDWLCWFDVPSSAESRSAI
jgi:hypothetical protein